MQARGTELGKPEHVATYPTREGAVKRLPGSPHLSVILLEAGLVTEAEVGQAVLRQRETGLRIGEALVEMEAVPEEDVVWALSRQLGLPVVDIDPSTLDQGLMQSFPESVLRRCRAVPLAHQGEGILVAMDDPTDERLVAELERVSEAPLTICLGKQSAIWNALDAIFGAAVARPLGCARKDAEVHHVIWEHSGVTLLAFHVARAVSRGATAILFAPRNGRLGVHYREYGLLRLVTHEPAQVHDFLLARIAALGGPVLDGRMHARGIMKCPLPTGEITLAVALLRHRDGISVTIVPRQPLTPARGQGLQA